MACIDSTSIPRSVYYLSCIVVLGLGRMQKEDAVFWTVGEHIEFMFISQLVLLAHTDHCLSIVPCHILTI